MIITSTPLEGCLVITPKVFNDDRGYFFESYNTLSFNKAVGYEVNFVQDNQSYSKKGVFRSLHLQKGEHAQAKLVRITKGEVLDIAVDFRKALASYGQYFSVKLSEENNQQFFIPLGLPMDLLC
jgi:dTDP-4-dehydrorhamnose 3,5-epimerase